MADVRLDFYDLDADALPDLCMKCGAPAVARPVKTFTWIPYWARFMGVLGTAFMKRCRVPCPLCERHKRHWTIRYVVGIGGILLVLALFLPGLALFAANAEDDPDGPLTLLGGALMGIAGLLFVAYLVTVIALAVTAINVFEITDDTIYLKNVHPDFVRAYREQTRPGIAPEVDAAVRDRWGRPAPRRRAGRDDYPPDDKYERR